MLKYYGVKALGNCVPTGRLRNCEYTMGGINMIGVLGV